MKLIPTFLALFVLLACAEPARQGFQVSPADTLQLKKLKEELWPRAYYEHDPDLLDRILDDDFEMIDDEGTWSDKTAELEWVRTSTGRPDSFYYEIKRLDIYSNGTAVIAGTGHIFNFADSSVMTYQSSNILIKRDSLWKAVTSHVSGVK